MTPEAILDAADVLGNAGCPEASVRGYVDGIEGGLSRADSLSMRMNGYWLRSHDVASVLGLT
jgi:hypothetical protein